MSPTPSVEHVPAKTRFEFGHSENPAVLEYEITGTEIVIHHTFVPEEFRGQGIAARLTKAAVEYATQHQLTLIPECSYVAAYLKRHWNS